MPSQAKGIYKSESEKNFEFNDLLQTDTYVFLNRIKKNHFK